MSSLRDRAREIKETADRERKNIELRSNSIPVKLYRYWSKNTNRCEPVQKNFCHVFWVCVLRAPGLFLCNVVTHKATLALLTLLAVCSVIWLLGAYNVTVVAISTMLVLLIIVGVAMGIIRASMGSYGRVDRVLFWATIPVSAPTFLLALGAARAASKVEKLWHRTGWDPVDAMLVCIAVCVLTVMALLGYWWFSLMGMLGLVVIIGVFALVATAYIALKWCERYALARRAKKADKNAQFISSRVRCDDTEMAPEPKKPTRVSKFVLGLGDILILIGQFIRAKKLKTCPFVTIPEVE